MCVALEAHVDSLRGMPELIESRVKVKIHANRHCIEQLGLGEHSRDVHQQVGRLCCASQLVVLEPHRLSRALQQKR